MTLFDEIGRDPKMAKFWPKWAKFGQNRLSEFLNRKMDACNRFPVSNNPSLEYHHAYIEQHLDFYIFQPIFPRSNMGVAKNNFSPLS